MQNYWDAKALNPGMYNLFGRNCVTCVQEALAAAGIPTDPAILPSDVFYPLKYPGGDSSQGPITPW
jgi:hypothetical protein